MTTKHAEKFDRNLIRQYKRNPPFLPFEELLKDYKIGKN